jgi:hypothetical protein
MSGMVKGGHADSYNELTVNWISGRSPDLFIYADSGEELEKISLAEVWQHIVLPGRSDVTVITLCR